MQYLVRPDSAVGSNRTRTHTTTFNFGLSMRLDPYEVVHALGSVQIDRNAVVIEAPSKRRVGSGRGAAGDHGLSAERKKKTSAAAGRSCSCHA